jgi:hypothetical protein
MGTPLMSGGDPKQSLVAVTDSLTINGMEPFATVVSAWISQGVGEGGLSDFNCQAVQSTNTPTKRTIRWATSKVSGDALKEVNILIDQRLQQRILEALVDPANDRVEAAKYRSMCQVEDDHKIKV